LEETKLDALAEQVAGLIIQAKKLVVFTGAGISTESGIPDFRSPGGIWSRFDPDDFTYQKFVADAGARRKQWQLLGEGHLTTEAQPNAAHYAIAELDRVGKLDCVITQNVDNLHQKAGVPAEKVFELHGNMQRAVCLDCGRLYPFEQIKARQAATCSSWSARHWWSTPPPICPSTPSRPGPSWLSLTSARRRWTKRQRC
jgi:NAD-dependent deacetylase